jgi:NAD(P)-dependent dehydrogenase (short-subunit alcohol dehydrogenase family)
MRHADRVVLITGAAQWMGEACARRFLDEGAAGLVLNHLDAERPATALRDLKGSGYGPC